MKKILMIVGMAIAGLVASMAIAGVSPAQAYNQFTGKDIKDQSLESRDIAAEGVGASEVRNGSLTGGDMNPNTVKRFLAGERAQAEIDANKDAWAEDKVGMSEADADAKYAPKASPVYGQGTATVADIGGTFGKFPDNVRATILDTIDLPAGKYVVTSEGFFINNDATSGQTRMQLAVRVEDGSDWGVDLGTCFTGAISPLKNRESHCSSTRVVTLAEDSTVKVYGFGYADDQGSADSGKVNATSFVTALPAS